MPIFVIGPGRSGTSTTARLLHTHFGISMGKRFAEPDWRNAKGAYEDLDFREVNSKLVTGKISFSAWHKKVKECVGSRKEPWGCKDPVLSYLLGHYLDLTPNALLIRTRRNIHSIVKSCAKCYGWPYLHALGEMTRREALLDQFTVGREVYMINFDAHIDDDHLISKLQYILLGKYYEISKSNN